MKATDSGIKEASAAADVKVQMELRVKVALLLGHKWVRFIQVSYGSPSRIYYQLLEPRHLTQDWWKRQGGVLIEPSEIPNPAEIIADTDRDWPNDLNACAEFEEKLKDDCDLWMKYMALLVGKPWHFAWEADEVWGAVNATAEQRCRAFVKTMEATE